MDSHQRTQLGFAADSLAGKTLGRQLTNVQVQWNLEIVPWNLSILQKAIQGILLNFHEGLLSFMLTVKLLITQEKYQFLKENQVQI